MSRQNNHVHAVYMLLTCQGTEVSEATEFRESFSVARMLQPTENIEMKVIVHRGDDEPPQFIDEDEGRCSGLRIVTDI
jgi:hypothetical protein